jgi:hypothetical protein
MKFTGIATVNKEMYIDILRRLGDAVRGKRSENGEPTIEFYVHQSVHSESIFKKCSNKMTLFCTFFYYLQTALHVSDETFTHHQELE